MTALQHFIASQRANYKTYSKETMTEIAFSLSGDTVTIDFQWIDTKQKTDLRLMMNILQKYYKGDNMSNLLHAGFLEKWNSIYEFVIEFILKHEPKNILLRGISGGGALAIIAHWILTKTYLQMKVNTITFGAPRVFSIFAIKEIFKNVIQYETARDFICRLPPIFLLYKHHGKRVIINHVNWFLRLFPSIKSHTPEEYIKHLKNYSK